MRDHAGRQSAAGGDRRVVVAGLVVRLDIGGFFDGIVSRQLLQ
jgi:uncharacterized membrane protein